ncbi:hypothetical protein ACJ6WF_42040 [Streptomyces sp. MMS24-I2-30]
MITKRTRVAGCWDTPIANDYAPGGYPSAQRCPATPACWNQPMIGEVR